MKCLSCDEILTDREAVRKYPDGDYLDLCDSCYYEIKDYVSYYDEEILDERELLLPKT